MRPVETIIVIILLLMSIPDLCRKIGRPALANCAYVLFGLLAGQFLTPQALTMLQQVGMFGFILLLFTIGLEIDLPDRRQTVRSIQMGLLWMALQAPAWILIGKGAGFSWVESLLGAVALSGCSVGIAFAAWRHFTKPDKTVRMQILHWMVALEVLSVILISVSDGVAVHGLTGRTAWRITGMSVAIILTAMCAKRLAASLDWVLSKTIRWKVHTIVLGVLGVAAIGDRFGLSAPKTAFFLGLFVSRATHEGMALEHHLKPIGERLLIPIFFVSLGAYVPPQAIFSVVGLWAVFAAMMMFALRWILFQRVMVRWLPAPVEACLLAGPNLTMAAVMVQGLPDSWLKHELVPWMLLTALLMTVGSVLLMPGAQAEDSESSEGLRAELPEGDASSSAKTA